MTSKPTYHVSRFLIVIPLVLLALALGACGGDNTSVDTATASVGATPTPTLPEGMASAVERQARLMHHMLKSTWDQLGKDRKTLMEDGFERGWFELVPAKLTDECVANMETLKQQIIQLLGRSDYPAQQEILDLLLGQEARSCRLDDLEIIGYYEKLRALTR